MIRYLRSKHSRLAFISDQDILEIYKKINKPKELLQSLEVCFPGIKELEIESQIIKNNEIFLINGFETYNNEKIYIKSPIKLDLSSKYDLYFLDLVSKIEDSMRDYLKNNILKTLQNFYKHSFDYVMLFKSLTSKTNCFQSLYLIHEMLFFYEITHFLKVCKLKNLSLDKELLLLKEKMNEKFLAFKNAFIKQVTSTFSRTLHYSFVQFSMQIISHINIIDYFIDSHIQEISDFEYLIIPKFSFDIPKSHLKEHLHDVIHSTIQSNPQVFSSENFNSYSSQSSYFPKIISLTKEDIKVSLLVLNYKIAYGYEFTKKFPSGLVHETTFKALVSLMLSITSFFGTILRGEKAAGKKNTLETMSIELAKPTFFISLPIFIILFIKFYNKFKIQHFLRISHGYFKL